MATVLKFSCPIEPENCLQGIFGIWILAGTAFHKQTSWQICSTYEKTARQLLVARHLWSAAELISTYCYRLLWEERYHQEFIKPAKNILLLLYTCWCCAAMCYQFKRTRLQLSSMHVMARHQAAGPVSRWQLCQAAECSYCWTMLPCLINGYGNRAAHQQLQYHS